VLQIGIDTYVNGAISPRLDTRILAIESRIRENILRQFLGRKFKEPITVSLDGMRTGTAYSAYTESTYIPPVSDDSRDEHGILKCIFKPCAGIKPTLPPIDAPYYIEEILNQCKRNPTERAELIALGGYWAAGEETPQIAILASYMPVRERYSRRTRDMLAGKHQNEYSNRAQFEAATILSLVWQGASLEDCFLEFETNPVAGRFRVKQDIGWFKSAYKSAVRKVDAGDSQKTKDTRRQLEKLYTVVAIMNWTGKSAITDRKVLKAVMLIAHKVGSLTIHASHYEVSEVAVIPRQTADDALSRLCKSGIMKLVSDGHQHRYGSVYRLNLAQIEKGAMSSHLLFGVRSKSKWPSCALFLNELFSARALPSSSQEIYESLLVRGPLKTAQLTSSGRSLRTVKDTLKLLAQYNLVRKSGKLYQVNESCNKELLSRFLEVHARQSLIEKHQTLREKRFDKKTGKLKREVLKTALAAKDEETLRPILHPKRSKGFTRMAID